MKLLQHYLLLTPETETITKSGLYIALETQNKQLYGKVEFVGKEVEDISVGDRVLYDSLNSSDIHLLDKDFKICEDSDIIAIMENKER